MGLLDDAIREHLELKRRRGADPADVTRLEREALGPVRRGAEPEGEAEAPEPEVAYAEPALAGEPAAEELAHEEEGLPYEEEPGYEAPVGGEPAYEEAEEEPWGEQVESWEEPEPRRAAAAPESAGQETREFQVSFDDELEEEGGEEPARGEQEEPGEDVLEETPDFLQETPEHDRLWFEQRPPRDFDFGN